MAPRRFTSSNHIPPEDVKSTDTVIVGNGPSALFLSYLLHGNIPTYDSATHGPHPDPVLHAKLSRYGNRPLFDAIESTRACEVMTEHFHAATYMSYSSQALPLNVLLDTLVQPGADTEIGEAKSRLRWSFDQRRRIGHVVLGSAKEAGGQWSEDPVSTSWDIKTLSYAEMLSLPGYSFREHYRRKHGKVMPDLNRPTRREVSNYYSTYPRAVGISSEVFSSVYVQRINRTQYGFSVKVYRMPTPSRPQCEYTIHCKHLILATGIFTNVIPPPPIFLPLLSPANNTLYQQQQVKTLPLLVVGSGFTAADVVTSAQPGQKIIHIFKWNTTRPSPLKACHSQAYPEYASIYRQMKQSAADSTSPTSPTTSSNYEGFPNAQVIAVSGDGRVIRILTADGDVVERTIGTFKYCVGRRGSLEYLSAELRKAVGVLDAGWVSADTLRRRVESDLEVTKNVWVIGSLTGDSLVRYGFGGCVYAAGRIMADREIPEDELCSLDDAVQSSASYSR
ncbi:hypothetical protein L873DRAFT_1833813 [Choiromyces venosus 120613-1]|uniref:L-ornithine N(5)-oxygenase n=1 Tax=Choiromyces venosus 120613-1 TaxID=1336337 RepID=A0A3N4K1D2_9PEZI|nr:hypothetical protein L873DRAFT_1833813 [Choiromyces venosus 120613-1]